MRTVRAMAAAAGVAGILSAAQAGTVAWLELEGKPLERPEALAWLSGPDAKPTLRDFVATLHEAAVDPDVEAVTLRLREPELQRSQVEELGAALRVVREAGKKVHLFTEIYGPTELLLAAYADEAIVQTGGAVTLPGLYMEEMFLADTLAWAGAKADFVQIGDYKGAMEQLANSAPSKAWDENINQLLDGMYGSMRRDLKEGRGLSDEALDEAMRRAWLASPEEAVRLGLVDKVMDRMDVDAHLTALYGEHEVETRLAGRGPAGALASNPFAMLETLMNPPAHEPTRETIAVVHIDGAIVDGESQGASPLGGASVGSLTIRQALAKIEDDDRIKGVVVRIDSPGGSAIASESIWQGVRRVAERKPVWVSVGSMAASGGYYILSAGSKVYVNPSSIVGSIGVVGGKVALGGVYDRLKMHVVPRVRGPRGDLMSALRPWTEEERGFIRERMTETYDLFVKRVREGRPGIDISRTAEGRLFTGERAIELGMADALGGLDQAIDDLAGSVGLTDYDVLDYPAPKGLAEVLEEAMGRFGMVASPDVSAGGGALGDAAATLRQVVGERAWPSVRDALQAMLQLRTEPVLLTAPRILIQP